MEHAHKDLASEVDFSIIRYAQCWEDTNVVLGGLDIQPGDTCLSIASAGDNTLSLLTKGPARVIAVDLSPTQIAVLELRVIAYRYLTYPELLALIGIRFSNKRLTLYSKLRPHLSRETQRVWDAHADAIKDGIGKAGKFEHYLDIFRRYVLPLTHSRQQLEQLFATKTVSERRRFYGDIWNNWRWRLLLKLFCSRTVMGLLGRDPRFFSYVEGDVADRIFERIEYALTELDPAENPYLHWICFGNFENTLPYAFREENFELIRNNLDRLEWHMADVQEYLRELPDNTIDRFNMSDIFEYMSKTGTNEIMTDIARVGRCGGRMAYWNMLVPRYCPRSLRNRMHSLHLLSEQLHQQAQTFFYGAFVVEEIL